MISIKEMKKKHVMIASFIVVTGIVLYYFLIFNGGINSKHEDFSIIVLPDTQIYAWKNNSMLDSQIDWILNSVEQYNIKFVIQVGDLVHYHDNETQWKYVNASFSKLDGIVPYSVTTGNHDIYGIIDTNKRETDDYDKYFPPERFEMSDNFQEYFRSTENSYHYFEGGGKEYMVLNLGNCPKGDAVFWGKSIVNDNPDKDIIFVTHTFLNARGVFTNKINDQINCQYYPFCKDGNCYEGEALFNIFAKEYDNVNLFLSGHFLGQSRRTDYIDGRPINSVLQNYQHLANGGESLLRIYTFKKDWIEVSTIAPYYQQQQSLDLNQKFILSTKRLEDT